MWHLGKLYLIGGYTIEYDCELKCFYQSPVCNVWIFDPSMGSWCMGPPLPKESFVAKNKTIKFRGYCLGEYNTAQYITMEVDSYNIPWRVEFRSDKHKQRQPNIGIRECINICIKTTLMIFTVLGEIKLNQLNNIGVQLILNSTKE